MKTEEIRKQIVKLMEQRDRAWLDSKSPKEAEEVVDNCNRGIMTLNEILIIEIRKENTLAKCEKQLRTVYKNS